jgi:endo-1,4-beta-xylanase
MTLSSKFNQANAKSIKFTSSNKKVTVDKNGKIKAVKKGSATIKAVVTLKNGTKKTVKMKVTIK